MNAGLPGTTNCLALESRRWLVTPRRIGGTLYQGDCLVARVLHVSYQQQSTVYGSSGGVFGLSHAGSGLVGGGGGYVDTIHRGIVSVVIEAEDGGHATHELPASVSALANGMLRLDRINGQLVAVTNVTGRQAAIIVLGPSTFIGTIGFARRHAILAVATVMMAGQLLSSHPLRAAVATLLCAALPLLRLRRIRMAERDRERFKNYMLEVMT